MYNPTHNTTTVRTKIIPWILFGILILPLLYYWMYSIWWHPSHNYFTNDAEYPYFVNSLAIFKGGEYGYIDHPGTPLEIVGTFLLGVEYLFTPNEANGFVFYYLQNPSRFFSVARVLLAICYFITTCLFFRIAFDSNAGNVFYAVALSVIYYAIHPDSLSQSMIWNHNSFNFPLGTLLLLVLYRNLKTSKLEAEISYKILIALGAFSGILASITIYMAGWIIGTMATVFAYYILQKAPWKQIIWATVLTAISAIGGFFISVLPILDKLGHFRNWIVSLLTHQSNYLNVPKDQPRLERLFSNFLEFRAILPVMFTLFVLLLVSTAILFFVFRHRLAENTGLWALIIGLTIQTLVILLIFFDRPLQMRYFLSIAAILPIWAMAIFELLRPYYRIRNMLGMGLVVFGFMGMIMTTINSVDAKRNEIFMLAESEHMMSSAIQSFAAERGRSPEDIIVLYMYGSYSNCWGIRLGDSKAYDVFYREIERICPNQYLLSTGLRVDKFGNNNRIENEPWDMIFACDRHMERLRTLNMTLHVHEHPELNWMCGTPVVVTHD